MASYYISFPYTLIVSCICLFSSMEAAKPGGITLDLIHRDTPLSPLYDPSKTSFQRLRTTLLRSFSSKNSTSLPTQAFESPLTPVGGDYLMKIQIGTPAVDIMAFADTGSDLTWTQCKPCVGCFQQNAPFFDPSQTSTYGRVSCKSMYCPLSAFGIRNICDGSNNCAYVAQYGDGLVSIGDLAVETITFQDSGSGERVPFPNVMFGCEHVNRAKMDRAVSGIVGLGAGPLSIINQLGTSVNGRFSYCLTHPDSGVSSKIMFGTNAVVSGPEAVSTPITRKSYNTFYYLTLEGLSVGNNKIFQSKSNSNSNSKAAADDVGNILIDSGTSLTYIPMELYTGLESELVNVIQGTPREVDRGKMFKLCYVVASDVNLDSPPVVLHFTGADVVVPHTTLFVEVDQGIRCLSFVPSDGGATFGNLHQVNFLVGYDLQRLEVTFLPTDCTKFS